MKDIIKKTDYRSMGCIGRPDIYLKFECNQFANSFKARGIVNFLTYCDNLNGLVTFTTGNHGIAVALIAQKLQIPAVVVTTDKINSHKRTILEHSGALIRQIASNNLEEGITIAKRIACEFNYTFVPLYDDNNLLNGYSEIGNEICKDFKKDVTVFFPIGSGSLLYANARMIKSINPNNTVVGVEPMLYRRIDTIKLSTNPSSSLADSLSIDRIPKSNLEFTKYTDSILAIDEDEILESIKIINRNFNLVAEGSGAITLAAALKSGQNNSIKVAVITGKNCV